MTGKPSFDTKISTGIPGLDEVLGGGLPKDGLYLLQGSPGVGKTTLALQFLLEGLNHDEKGMYIPFSDTHAEISAVCRAHGFPLEKLSVYHLSESRKSGEADQTMFHPAEVELEEITTPILDELDRVKPSRVVIDSVSELRLLAREPLRYRKQLLALKQFFLDRNCTALLIDDRAADKLDDVAQTIVHGIFILEKFTPIHGSTRRRLRVEKLRGIHFREGSHNFRIETGGIVVFPRLPLSEQRENFSREPVWSGVKELDGLLAGGLDRGTSTLFTGAAGAGKSSLAAQFAFAAAERGEKTGLYLFEERIANWLTRAASMGLDSQKYVDSGHLRLTQVASTDLSPGEFAANVREVVERQEVRLIVIDSLNAYLQMVHDDLVVLHLHELLTYLGHQGVTTFMVLAQQGMLGGGVSPVDVSYLADNVILIRYFESGGAVRQAISVVKKRTGKHERTLREFSLGQGGVKVGEPLKDFHGVLTGVPTYHGSVEGLGNRDEPKRR